MCFILPLLTFASTNVLAGTAVFADTAALSYFCRCLLKSNLRTPYHTTEPGRRRGGNSEASHTRVHYCPLPYIPRNCSSTPNDNRNTPTLPKRSLYQGVRLSSCLHYDRWGSFGMLVWFQNCARSVENGECSECSECSCRERTREKPPRGRTAEWQLVGTGLSFASCCRHCCRVRSTSRQQHHQQHG